MSHHTDLSYTQLSRQRHRQHQGVKLILLCLHRLSYLWTKHHVYVKRDAVTVLVWTQWMFKGTLTFTAWVLPHSSWRIPKHTTHTRDSSSFSLSTAAASSSDGASVTLGSSFALLLGGSSDGSDAAASWDLLFPSADSAAVESWDLVFSVLLMKAWSSLSVSCVRWNMTRCMFDQ